MPSLRHHICSGHAAIVQPITPTVIGSFEEFCSLFLHQFGSSRKHRKTKLSLFSIRQKEGEPLKEYVQHFNTAALEVPMTTCARIAGRRLFKSLAKKPATKFDALLARAAKYINMEDAQASKREGRGEKRKENKDEGPSKKPRTDFKDKRPVWQRVNTLYTPLAVPITQALMAVEGKVQAPEEQDRTTNPNDYLQEYVCWEKARGTGSYLKYEINKDKNVKNSSPGSPVKNVPGPSMTGKAEVTDPLRKYVIRMIACGPVGGDSQRVRKTQVREAYGTSAGEVMEVEPTNDTSLIQLD
ncbi:UNVERIFIED_CONTAM: hypothetical protein Sradi_1336400 [Sesamum radiatum]|uniref:Retrotransposon gag domain-containing protein n=1 Tax=Sesamum radiatum TaxID=300843 RepID=A0AAW2UPH4_SESRA